MGNKNGNRSMKHNQAIQFLKVSALLLAAAFIAGCASDKSTSTAKPEAKTEAAPAEKTGYKNRQYAANPSKVKFGEFKAVEMKPTTLPPQEDTEANRKNAQTIDGLLVTALKGTWPDLKVIPAATDFSKGGERTLQIMPRIEHIRLVSVGSRVWLGAMAGGSDLVMHVDFRDSSTGELIANPDFWKGNSAWSGGWGSKDNQIRDAAVAQILGYVTANK
jgi:hypothetical protein